MGLYGTKCCNDSAHNWSPEILGDLYRKIRVELDDNTKPFKPRPGDSYRKTYKPLSRDMDTGYFRKLPSDIIVTSPPRLFRSMGRSYKGKTYLECEYYWSFDYKTPWGDGWKYDSLHVWVLSYCYIYTTVTFTNPIQLSLF